MLRKPHYTFLYVPGDHAQTRPVRVPRMVFFAAGTIFVTALVLAGCFLVAGGRGRALARGAAGGGGDEIVLRAEIDRLEQKVALLRSDVSATFRLQETVAAAVGLDTLGATVQAAGVGGRNPYTSGAPRSSEGERLAAVDGTLEQLLRQARIQRQGYEAILDTLRGQASARDHVPSIRPVDGGWVSSGFGMRNDPFTGKPTFHDGIDFSVPLGTPIHATADGTVRDVLFERGFGHLVVIEHSGRTVSRYAHLSRPLVQRGQRVRRGDVIAQSGRSGRATSPHLHYEVLVNGRPANPLSYVLDAYAWRR